MSAVAEILAELSRRGVAIRAEGQAIRLRPKAALDDDLLDRIRDAKAELLMVLRDRPATCAASCYEIEPGRWVHHPWNGCNTVLPRPAKAAQKTEQTCWHCGGKGKCDCVSCGRYGARAEWTVGPCLPCEAQKRQPVH